jgi:hypothetical protein
VTLGQVRRFALALPGTSESPHFHYTSFRVAKRIFATALPAGEFVHIFIPEEERDTALALEPRAVEKLFWGVRVVGVRVALNNIRPAFVTNLLQNAWAHKGPHAVASAFDVRKRKR